MSVRRGIDVSSYQGTINWEKVRQAGCEYAVLKITRKDLTADKQFQNNLTGCKKQGIPWDVYRYVYEDTAASARAAALAVTGLLKEHGAASSTRVWWDVEDASIRPSGSGEKGALTDSILAAQAVIEEAGYGFGVYCGWYWYKSVLDHRRLTCPFWIARYPFVGQLDFGTVPEFKYRPETTQPLWGWQFSSKGKISGIGGSVDLNEIYLADPEDSAAAADPVTRFQLWMWEQGENRLAADGSFGPKSRQAAVRVLQRLLNVLYMAGLTVDGIFGPKTKKAVVPLKKEARGNLVFLLQGLLYAAGRDPKGFDGVFGENTEAAVRSFQQAKGLTADGLAGKDTFEKLVM